MPPLTIMIKPVSGACNLRCAYCFYTDVMARREVAVRPPMSVGALETLVRRAFAYADGSVTFAFQGGEPTLIGLAYFEALTRFERQYNTRGLEVSNSVQTNGFALSDEMIRFFARERFLLGVSLDGTAPLHDALRRDRAGAARSPAAPGRSSKAPPSAVASARSGLAETAAARGDQPGSPRRRRP